MEPKAPSGPFPGETSQSLLMLVSRDVVVRPAAPADRPAISGLVQDLKSGGFLLQDLDHFYRTRSDPVSPPDLDRFYRTISDPVSPPDLNRFYRTLSDPVSPPDLNRFYRTRSDPVSPPDLDQQVQRPQSGPQVSRLCRSGLIFVFV